MRFNPSNISCIHKLFEAQAGRAPDAVAATFEKNQLTYGELNRRANKLAHHLRGLGVGAEVLCGIYVERSLDMLVAILGTLKAGGAYVPIDPAYPKERVAFMLEDAGRPVLLTQKALADSLPEHEARVICLDSDWETVASASDENPASEVTPDNLAYVIYTSGSTGQPKGVQVTHGSVARLFETTRPLLDFGERDVWTVFHSFAFDLSVWEIFGPLLHGGRLVIVPLNVAQSPAEFYELLRDERVTVLNQTPSALRQLFKVRGAAEKSAGGLSLRLVVCGGEALPREVAAQALAWRIPVWNFYGPTEATVWATVHEVKSEDLEHGLMPIGLAIASAETHLLDEDSRPVPEGEPGELHIGGPCLARGYFNRPDLTAARFISNPFSDEANARLYKTGDLARLLPDGSIEFLGRLDHQVKVRGFRIELGEIEAALDWHKGVRESVVTARDDERGEKRLVAYVVCEREAPDTSEMVAFLKKRLPDYMIPSAFVPLDAMPLTSNGKIDRRALPAPVAQRPQPALEFKEPAGEIEARLKGVWEKTLGVSPIGVNENFFELGGDSLLAADMLIQVHEVFGKRIPLSTLINEGTVEDLARVIETHTDEGPWASLIEFQTEGARAPLFFVHAVGGEALGYRTLARLLGPDQPFYGLQARGLDGRQEPLSKMETIASHYLEEVLSVRPEGPFLLGGYSFGAIVAFEMAQQLRARGHETVLLAVVDQEVPNVSGESRLSPKFMTNVARNLPGWLMTHVVERPKGEVVAAVRRHSAKLLRNAGSRLFNIEPHKASVGDVLNVDQMTEHHRRVSEALFQSLLAYRPRAYPGR
ncbi:MAG: amino acid adenylation domain-containing protein, partial [Rubrivivax sp.]|nr:amino acid adenylation domain-containing protein [Pyrinomonadaceae bacterium]